MNISDRLRITLGTPHFALIYAESQQSGTLRAVSTMDTRDLDTLIESLAEPIERMAPMSTADRLGQLRVYLIAEISRLLDTNVPLLMSTLYRIDVREEVLVECLSSSSREDLPTVLAELVIEREMSKVHLRRVRRTTPESAVTGESVDIKKEESDRQ